MQRKRESVGGGGSPRHAEEVDEALLDLDARLRRAVAYRRYHHPPGSLLPENDVRLFSRYYFIMARYKDILVAKIKPAYRRYRHPPGPLLPENNVRLFSHAHLLTMSVYSQRPFVLEARSQIGVIAIPQARSCQKRMT
jgi:hypothetical protein